MKKIISATFLAIIFFTFGFFSKNFIEKILKDKELSIKTATSVKKPLEIYMIENLKDQEIQNGTIKIENLAKETDELESYIFTFTFRPNPAKEETKKTTGLINIPKKKDKSPIILMLRGYVDQKLYTTGMGTLRASEVFTKNGFITISLDFLGYAGSDKEAENIFESRFQTYVTVLTLLKTLTNIKNNSNLVSAPDALIYRLTNYSKLFLWGHSNGGQIALTVLEITQGTYPTSLWAPVSKPFPYSILYYTDEAEDKGKLIRFELAKFEKDYDVDKYSLSNYFEYISAPIQIQQGTLDEEVPVNWSNELANKLKSLGKNVDYHIHNGANHNLSSSWNQAIQKDIDFFKKFIQ